MSELTSCIAAEEDSGVRLDVYLASVLEDDTRSSIKKMIKDKRVTINGMVCTKPAHNMVSGDELTVDVPPSPSAWPEPEDIPLDILYEDDDLVMVNKAAGMVVHPAPGHHSGTLVNAILHQCPDFKRAGEDMVRPGIVHRLDRDTSGVLVIAKKRSVAAKLGRAFQTRSVRKIYWTLVHGVPKPPQGKIEAALVKAASPLGERVRKARPGEQARAQSAVTYYSVVDRVGQTVSFVSLKPVTGRQHQLRAHMTIIGNPILGDEKYPSSSEFPEGIDRQLHLHARRISFPHPSGEGVVDVTAPLPPHMVQAFTAFGFALKDDEQDELA